MLERSYNDIHAQFLSQSIPLRSKWDSISLQLIKERLFWVLTELMKQSYPDLLQPSIKELGVGLSTIIEFLGLPLMHLKLFNIHQKLRFKKRLEKLISSINDIPDNDRKELPSTIAVPAIDQLSIETDEDISDIYINLLTKASSSSMSSKVHPSFINTLKNMCNDEARLILYLQDKIDIPFIILRFQFNQTEGLDKTEVLTGIEYKTKLAFPDNIPLYLSNMTGLGIIERMVGSLSDTNKWYKPLCEIYEPIMNSVYEKGHTDGKKYPVSFLASYFKITSYGRMFIEACLNKYNINRRI